MFRDAMGIHRKTLGDGHPLVAVTLNSLSRVLRDQGREAEAASALEQALSIARPALGSDHQLIAIYALNLGAVQLARGDPQAAETLIREGLRIRQLSPQMIPNRRRIRPEDDWTIGAAKDLLGAALAAQKRYSRSRDRVARGAPRSRGPVTTAAARGAREPDAPRRALCRMGQACRGGSISGAGRLHSVTSAQPGIYCQIGHNDFGARSSAWKRVALRCESSSLHEPACVD